MLALGLSSIVVFAAIVILATGNGGESVQITGVNETNQLIGGIAQDGNALGSPEAPVTISIFDDLQCDRPPGVPAALAGPDCARWFLDTIPPLVNEYVRPDTAKLEFRNFAFGATDTNVAGVAAAAGGGQDREWQFAYLLCLNLERADSPIQNITDGFLRGIAGGAGGDGFDVGRWEAAREAAPAKNEAQADADLARDLDLRAEPAVVTDGPDGTRVLQDSPSLEEIQAAVAAVD